MKHHTFNAVLRPAVLLGGVILLAAACTNENDVTSVAPNESKQVTITATQPSTNQPALRVAFGTDGTAYWQTGDQLTVVSENGSDQSASTFSINSGANTASATFTGTIKGTRLAYALYPASDQHFTGNSDDITYNLPASYTYTQTNTDYVVDNGTSFNMPMMATFENESTTAEFKHIGGILAIKIDRLPAKTGTVTVTANENICGKATVNENENSKLELSTDAGKTVTFNYSNATAWSSGVFYLPLPAGEYSGVSITVKGTSVTAGDLTSTKTLASESKISISNGYIKKLKVNTDYSKTINNHAFVDLGLSSGILWATCNLGAESESAKGNYYAWGETTTKDSYGGDNYTFLSNGAWSKYTSSDNKTTLEMSDDAANTLWNSPCRIPTETECNTMLLNCNVTKSTSNNVSGYTITSKSNGKSIFLPVTGHYGSGTLGNTDKGYYWSSTVDSNNTNNAKAMVLDSSNSATGSSNIGRPYGCVIRAVVQP